jgi:hypothetical protein
MRCRMKCGGKKPPLHTWLVLRNQLDKDAVLQLFSLAHRWLFLLCRTIADKLGVELR